MKKYVALAVMAAAVTLSGCATKGDLKEVREIAEKAQASADAAQRTADQALSTANAAAAKAESAEAAAARVDEKVDQMFKKSMMK